MSIIGKLMLGLLFIGWVVWLARAEGWKVTYWAFLVTFVVIGWVLLAIHLLGLSFL